VHFHLEAGAALATCTGSLAALFGAKDTDRDGKGFMGGVWSVVGGGVAWQAGEKTGLFLDALLVSRGLQGANPGWVGRRPVAGPRCALTGGGISSLESDRGVRGGGRPGALTNDRGPTPSAAPPCFSVDPP